MSQLIVTIPRDVEGNPKHEAVKPSATKEGWSSVMLKQTVVSFGTTKTGGFVSTTKSRSAYWQVQNSVIALLGTIREGDDINAKLQGLGAPQMCIARKESFEPAYEGHQAKINPETNAAILVDGRAVYLQDFIAPMGVEDVILSAAQQEAPVAEHQEAGQLS